MFVAFVGTLALAFLPSYAAALRYLSGTAHMQSIRLAREVYAVDGAAPAVTGTITSSFRVRYSIRLAAVAIVVT